MAVLVGFGWIYATGMKNWSILLIFFINMIYYSYEMRLQNFEALHAVMAVLVGFGWIYATGTKN